jgi:hypothetical protein
MMREISASKLQAGKMYWIEMLYPIPGFPTKQKGIFHKLQEDPFYNLDVALFDKVENMDNMKSDVTSREYLIDDCKFYVERSIEQNVANRILREFSLDILILLAVFMFVILTKITK